MCTQISLLTSGNTMEVDTLNEINELSCLNSFVTGDHEKALQLLPSLRQPAAIRTLCICCNIDSGRKLCTDVSLLHLAAFHGWMEIVISLVSMYDCNTQCRDSWKQTPLHYAAYGGSLPVVEYFISRQHCDPNSRGEKGRTPLHYASDRGHIDIIQYLITKAGCHPGILDNNKDAAVHFASFSGRLNVVKYIIQEMNCNGNSPGILGRTPLHQACCKGHMDIIRYLITEHGCGPVIKDNDGDMPIHIACLCGHLNVVKYLITEQRCDPNVKGGLGWTTLHNACDMGHMDIIRYLITEHGCDPVIKDNDGDMPIHIACLGGHLNVVKYLITEQLCDPNVKGGIGWTTLHNACNKGHMDIIRYLITEHGCDPVIKDNDGDMPIHIACLCGHLNVVKYLITEQRCDPNVKGAIGRTLFHKACDKGHMDIIRYLITEHGCDPVIKDNDGDMPIHIACLGGHLNVVKYLITEQLCDPNVKGERGWTTLHNACNKGHMDIIRYLITEHGCDPVIKDNDGDMPIHIACLCGHLNVVKYLNTEQRCDPNIKGAIGRTLFHKACDKGHMDIIRYLITEHGCDPVIKDNDGDMPIHIACLCGHLNVVKYLITEQRCDPNVKGEIGWTTLHNACSKGHMDIIRYLITEQGCDPTVEDNNDDMPIHIACRSGQLNVVRYLITEQQCDPNVKGELGWTTLHNACDMGHMDIIRYLITEQGCDPVIKGNSGNMPIHIACLGGYLNVVKYLITEQRCDPNVKGARGGTLFHKACNKGHMDIIRYLITEQGCDPVVEDDDGDVPIHVASFGGHLNVVKYLITEQRCDPNIKGAIGSTALHYVCRTGHIDIIQYLISEQGSNPAITDDMFKTPLHVACNYGQVDVVQFLLRDRRVDALSMDKYGKSPADYVYFSNNSYQLLKLFEPLLKSREDFPIHLFTKVVLTGNSGAGKSSLAKVIAEQDTVNFARQSDTDFKRKSIHSHHSRIESEVETLTAGIDSYIVKSETIGNFVLYDLAGQSEYYFSQSVIMETVIQKTPAIFIDLVDLSKSEEEIAQAIHHWLTFIESTTSKTQEKSCVMIVGSHTDLLTEQQVITKATLVKDLVDRRVRKQRYEGFVGMDCRVVTDKITNEFFPRLLNFHTTISAYSQPVSVYCHELYAFLQTKLEKTACQLHELVSFLTAEEDSLVPSDVPILSELLEDLSGKGVIIYLKNEQCLEKSWVVVKREIILKDVNGELFKPKYFKGFHPIASSTGIIRMSSLAELFPQYDPEMLVELMIRLEFCHPVNLAGITTNLQPICPLTSIKNLTDILLFFPSLLQAKRPQTLVTEDKQDRFGWCLGCKDYEYQILTSRFLHILLLRLAYTFPLPSEKYGKTHNLHEIEQNCSVWLNGISWNNEEGITTVVEVIQQKRWVVVTMYYNKDMTRPVEYSKHRSAVIRLILELQKELAPDLETFECLISPSLLETWPIDDLPGSVLFPIKNVANCVLRNKLFVLSCDGGHELLTHDAVLFEPYHTLSVPSVCELMDSSNSDQPVSSDLLNQVNEYCQHLVPQNHTSLREYLDNMSIYAGRNILVSDFTLLYVASLFIAYRKWQR